jgi:hypothetical protein
LYAGPSGGPNRKTRNNVPRRDQRRQHHQRLRQLYQRHNDDDDSWRGNHRNAAQSAGQRCGPDIQSQLGQTPSSSHAPTPTSSFPTRESSQPTNGLNKAGGGSKKKKVVDDEDDDGKSIKRQKISYGRE